MKLPSAKNLSGTYFSPYIEGIRRFTSLPLYVRIAAFAAILLAVILVSSLFYFNQAHAFSGGSGTADDPYVITTCAELESLGADQALLHDDYVLGNDINCSGIPDFQPLGAINQNINGWSHTNIYFTGRFDGAGHTISNVTINLPDSDGGIFLGMYDAAIRNLKLDTISVTVGGYGGALAGYADSSTLVGVTVSNSTINSNAQTGGVIGYYDLGGPLWFGNGQAYSQAKGYAYDVYLTNSTVNSTPYSGPSSDGAFGFINSSIPLVNRTQPYTAPSSPTSIGSCSALGAALLANPDGWYTLSGNIDCTGATDFPFATTSNYYFTGTLDGQGHTISGISITASGIMATSSDFYGLNLGLFGSAADAVFENFSLAGSGMTGDLHTYFDSVGGLVGSAGAGTVLDNVHSTLNVTADGNNLGGLVGDTSGGITIEDSSVAATIDPNDYPLYQSFVGGLLGYGQGYDKINGAEFSGTIGGVDVTIRNSLFTIVKGFIGGIAGYIDDGVIDGLGSSGTITGATRDSVAGLLGFFGDCEFPYPDSLTNSSSTMDYVSGVNGAAFGGLIGESYCGVDISDVSYDGTVNVPDTTGEGVYETGALVGDYENNLSIASVTLSNATTSLTILYNNDDPGADFSSPENVGGAFGELDSYGGSNTTVTNIHASSTMILGTSQAQSDGTIEDLGGLIGYTFGNINISSSTTNFFLSAPSPFSQLEDVGGIYGENDGSDDDDFIDTVTATDASTTMLFPIAAGARIEDVGGFVGFSEGVGYASSSAIADISISGDNSTSVGDLGGFSGEGDFNNVDFDDNYSYSFASTTIAVTADEFSDVGSFIGYSDEAAFSHVFAQGSLTLNGISADDSTRDAGEIGGFIGETDGSEFNNAYTTTAVSITADPSFTSGEVGLSIGGFAGEIDPDDNLTSIENAYSVGPLTLAAAGTASYDSVGGFAGASYGTSVTQPRDFGDVTSSSDGTHLALTADGSIYTSSDSGATWTYQTQAGYRNYGAITSSSDGSHLAATTIYGEVWTSSDYGVTWTKHANIGDYYDSLSGITSSSDGSHIAVADYGSGHVHLSTDYGATWTTGTATPGIGDITSSSDGSHLATVRLPYFTFGGFIYTSSDSGATWTQQLGAGNDEHNFDAITSSSDGSHLAATTANFDGSYDYIYTSTDYGVTWTQQTGSGTHSWSDITSSSDGSHLAATTADNGSSRIYTSTDYGVTWTQQTGVSSPIWTSIASSADGSDLVATGWNGIWYSSDGGNTWTQGSAVSVGGAPTVSYSFTATPLTLPASSTNVGVFVGSYDQYSTFASNAYSTVGNAGILCTGSDNPDPDWCTAHGTNSDFYVDSTAPETSWDFDNSQNTPEALGGLSTLWQENDCTYPTLEFLSALFGVDTVCGSGPTPTPPTLSTDAASSLSQTGATLNGSIDDIGTSAPTVRGFAYGTDTSYGATTTDSGSFSAGSFSDSLSSLTCAVTYHFRSYATSPDGTGYGSDQSFTTSACSSGGGSPPSSSGSSGQGSSAAPAVVPPSVISPVVPPVTPLEPPATSTSGTSGQSALPPAETPPAPPAAVTSVTPPPTSIPYVTVPSINPPLFTLPSLAAVSDLALKVFDPSTPSHAAAVTTGLALGLIGIIWTFLSGAYALTDIPLLLLRGPSLFGFLRRRKKHETWGTVYDSQTKRGLDPAIVTLYDASGNEVKQAVTDLDGRFGFDVAAGTYALTAGKTNHIFPARNLAPVDPIYTNRYEGGPIPMPSPGVLIKDVPLDPTKFDWNEAQKYHNGFLRFYSRFDRPLAYLSILGTILGAILALISVFIDPSTLNLVLIILYALMGILYAFDFAPRLYGSIRTKDGDFLANALIRVKSAATGSEVGHTVTDHLGRYYLLVPPTDHATMTIERLTGPDQYVKVWEGSVKTKGGYVNRRVRV